MKCPERFLIVQQNIKSYVINDNMQLVGDNHILIENQNFANCYEEQCVAWDKENQRCRKF